MEESYGHRPIINQKIIEVKFQKIIEVKFSDVAYFNEDLSFSDEQLTSKTARCVNLKLLNSFFQFYRIVT